MKAAVIGYGVIGKHHAKILEEMGILAAVCDVSRDTLEGLCGVELYVVFNAYVRALFVRPYI